MPPPARIVHGNLQTMSFTLLLEHHQVHHVQLACRQFARSGMTCQPKSAVSEPLSPCSTIWQQHLHRAQQNNTAFKLWQAGDRGTLALYQAGGTQFVVSPVAMKAKQEDEEPIEQGIVWRRVNVIDVRHQLQQQIIDARIAHCSMAAS